MRRGKWYDDGKDGDAVWCEIRGLSGTELHEPNETGTVINILKRYEV